MLPLLTARGGVLDAHLGDCHLGHVDQGVHPDFPGDRRHGPGRALLHFADIDLAEFLIHRADRAALRLIPEWLREAHTRSSEDVLVRTIRVFADCSLNVKETARRLGVHTNTVYFRLNQIKRRTGADPRTFSGTSFLLTALRLLDRHSQDNGPS